MLQCSVEETSQLGFIINVLSPNSSSCAYIRPQEFLEILALHSLLQPYEAVAVDVAIDLWNYFYFLFLIFANRNSVQVQSNANFHNNCSNGWTMSRKYCT